MTTETTTIVVPTAALIDAARDLNEYVVSLDRIFSRLGTGDYPDSILTDYMVQRRVPQRLAQLRRLVCDALEDAVGAEETERIAEEAYAYEDPVADPTTEPDPQP